MTVAVPEAVTPAKQVLTEFRPAAKRRKAVTDFRRVAKHRPLESFLWDRKADR